MIMGLNQVGRSGLTVSRCCCWVRCEVYNLISSGFKRSQQLKEWCCQILGWRGVGFGRRKFKSSVLEMTSKWSCQVDS